MSKTLSVRIPDKIALKLSEIAKEAGCSKSFCIREALEAYLSEIADFQVARGRLSDVTDPIVSIAEVRHHTTG